MSKKTQRLLATLVALAAFAAGGTMAALAQAGGPYDLSFSAINAGGGVSSGGPYTMMDTIGQPSTDAFQGGPYVFEAGFWAPDSARIPIELSAIVIR